MIESVHVRFPCYVISLLIFLPDWRPCHPSLPRVCSFSDVSELGNFLVEKYQNPRDNAMRERGLMADYANGLTETIFSDIRVFDDASRANYTRLMASLGWPCLGCNYLLKLTSCWTNSRPIHFVRRMVLHPEYMNAHITAVSIHITQSTRCPYPILCSLFVPRAQVTVRARNSTCIYITWLTQ